MPRTFSEETDRVLLKLNTWGKPRGSLTFPGNYDISDGRWRYSAETSDVWFRRIVDTFFRGYPTCCAIADNIGMLALIKWEEKTNLVYANIQTIIVSGGDLESFYLSDDLEKDRLRCQYLRLDLDMKSLGPLFKEPFPHIHSNPAHEPRFAFSFGDSGNVIMDFLEFIYKNYRYDEWMKWAENVWRKNAREAGEEDDPFEGIVYAFKAGKADLLQNRFSKDLKRLKSYLQQAKDSSYPLRVKKELRDLLNYP
ncbi:MAG: hypothetical protein DRI57_07820 [Deltaproteobacteria bacterium]|nr:MAG: hypothetical protein DRI57_07820 [Deltaproteobacteria bacterium]